MTKADYIQQMESIHAQIIDLKDNLKQLVKDANADELDGSVLSTIAQKRAQGKLSEFIEDLEHTLTVVRG